MSELLGPAHLIIAGVCFNYTYDQEYINKECRTPYIHASMCAVPYPWF